MKKFVLSMFFILCSLFHIQSGIAGRAGDIDNDGKIDLKEAIYALQVVSGIQSELPASTFIVWKGTWEVLLCQKSLFQI